MEEKIFIRTEETEMEEEKRRNKFEVILFDNQQRAQEKGEVVAEEKGVAPAEGEEVLQFGEGVALAQNGEGVDLAQIGEGVDLAQTGGGVVLAQIGGGVVLAQTGEGVVLAQTGEGVVLAQIEEGVGGGREVLPEGVWGRL